MESLLLATALALAFSANALELPQLSSLGMSHAQVPSGISQDYCQTSGNKGKCKWLDAEKTQLRPDKWDFSGKYRSTLPTLNFKTSSNHLLGNKTLMRVKYDISTGHYSEALTIYPSIKPSVELAQELQENMFLIVEIGLPTIGHISEKQLIDKNGLDFSFATARPWSEYNQVEFNEPGDVRLKFQWKFI